MTARRTARRAAGLLLAAAACASPARPPAPAPADDAPPARLLGAWVDDYGNRYAITPTTWTQLPHGRFHVRRWRTAGGYLIAQNDTANAHAPGRWTRIDWVELPDMAPWTWAFCLSAYEAPTAAAAESTQVARRDAPRTGCNGYPFSRMRRADDR